MQGDANRPDDILEISRVHDSNRSGSLAILSTRGAVAHGLPTNDWGKLRIHQQIEGPQMFALSERNGA